MENRTLGIFGTRFEAGGTVVYKRAADGTWPYARARPFGSEGPISTFHPHASLMKSLAKCNSSLLQQDKQDIIACCVDDMQLVPHTDDAKKGFPDGTFIGHGPVRYKYWLHHVDGSPEEAWKGITGEKLKERALHCIVKEWRAAKQANLAAPAAHRAAAAGCAGHVGTSGAAAAAAAAGLLEPASPANSGPAATAKQRAADAVFYRQHAAAAANIMVQRDETGHSAAATAAPKRAAATPAAAPAAKKSRGNPIPAAAAAAAAGAAAVVGTGAVGAANLAGSSDSGDFLALMSRVAAADASRMQDTRFMAVLENASQLALEAQRAKQQEQRAKAEAAITERERNRAQKEAAITERERIRAAAVQQLVMAGLQQLQGGGAAGGVGQQLLGGANMQALPAAACEIADES